MEDEKRRWVKWNVEWGQAIMRLLSPTVNDISRFNVLPQWMISNFFFVEKENTDEIYITEI